MSDIVITTAKRLPIGKFMGSLSSFSAPELGSSIINSLIAESGLSKDLIDEVIMGQVLLVVQQNPARQALMLSKIPDKASALTVNQVCGSGLRSVIIGFQSISSGNSEVVISGGQESMTNAHHTINVRNGLKMGDGKLKDSMIVDGLWCAMNNYHMGARLLKILQINLEFLRMSRMNLQQILKIKLKMLKKIVILKMNCLQLLSNLKNRKIHLRLMNFQDMGLL